MTEREFIQSIRQDYSGLNDRTRATMKGSVKLLAGELNAKGTHFIFELIQNAEDNDYPSGTPCLRFEVRQQEIEGTFGPVLIVHNNETGFREKCISQRHHGIAVLAESAKIGHHEQETDLLSSHNRPPAAPAL